MSAQPPPRLHELADAAVTSRCELAPPCPLACDAPGRAASPSAPRWRRSSCSSLSPPGRLAAPAVPNPAAAAPPMAPPSLRPELLDDAAALHGPLATRWPPRCAAPAAARPGRGRPGCSASAAAAGRAARRRFPGCVPCPLHTAGHRAPAAACAHPPTPVLLPTTSWSTTTSSTTVPLLSSFQKLEPRSRRSPVPSSTWRSSTTRS